MQQKLKDVKLCMKQIKRSHVDMNVIMDVVNDHDDKNVTIVEKCDTIMSKCKSDVEDSIQKLINNNFLLSFATKKQKKVIRSLFEFLNINSLFNHLLKFKHFLNLDNFLDCKKSKHLKF